MSGVLNFPEASGCEVRDDQHTDQPEKQDYEYPGAYPYFRVGLDASVGEKLGDAVLGPGPEE